MTHCHALLLAAHTTSRNSYESKLTRRSPSTLVKIGAGAEGWTGSTHRRRPGAAGRCLRGPPPPPWQRPPPPPPLGVPPRGGHSGLHRHRRVGVRWGVRWEPVSETQNGDDEGVAAFSVCWGKHWARGENERMEKIIVHYHCYCCCCSYFSYIC